jgi:hypothetical protein
MESEDWSFMASCPCRSVEPLTSLARGAAHVA